MEAPSRMSAHLGTIIAKGKDKCIQNITSSLRFSRWICKAHLIVKIRGKIDQKKKKKKKRRCMGTREFLGLLDALKRMQKIIQENAFEFIQRISLSTFKTTGERIPRLKSAERNKGSIYTFT